MAGKIRVHELARELGLTNKEALDLCGTLGIGVKTQSSSIEDAQADRVRRKAEREGLRRDVQPEEPAKPVKKGAGKKAAGGAEEHAPSSPIIVAEHPEPSITVVVSPDPPPATNAYSPPQGSARNSTSVQSFRQVGGAMSANAAGKRPVRLRYSLSAERICPSSSFACRSRIRFDRRRGRVTF